jgi:hypothetical protein
MQMEKEAPSEQNLGRSMFPSINYHRANSKSKAIRDKSSKQTKRANLYLQQVQERETTTQSSV